MCKSNSTTIENVGVLQKYKNELRNSNDAHCTAEYTPTDILRIDVYLNASHFLSFNQ